MGIKPPTSPPPSFPVTLTVKHVAVAAIQMTPDVLLEVNTSIEIAPLVSAENFIKDGQGYLRARIIVFISDEFNQPILGVTNNYSSFYVQEGSKSNGKGTYYNAWYFHFTLPTDQYLVNEIHVFNNLSNPKTSSGTVTAVQSITPPLS